MDSTGTFSEVSNFRLNYNKWETGPFDPRFYVVKVSFSFFLLKGHNVAEKVSVQFYCWEEGSSCNQPTLMSEELSLDYKCDAIQEVADLLISDPDNLTSSTHVDIQRKLCLGESIQPGQNSSDKTEQHRTPRLNEESLGLGQRLDKLKIESGSHNSEENPECWEPNPDEGCKLEPCTAVDVKITQAVSNMFCLLEWNDQKTQESQGKRITVVHFITLYIFSG